MEEDRRHRCLESANKAFADLKSRTQDWSEEQEERAAWDETVGDSLAEDE